MFPAIRRFFPGIFWSALPALLLFWGLVWRLVTGALARDGAFTYALDDPYIHLALAKNLAFHGVWGTSPHEFASASSSLAWTTILAACLRAWGDDPLWPLALNLFWGSVLILVLASLLRRALLPLWTALVTSLLVVAAPLPTLAVEGLEHPLHILATLLFLSLAADISGEGNALTRRQTWLFCALAALLPAVRYEGLFAVFAVMLALLWQRRIGLAAQIGACALAPLALFGLISVHQGALPFPNSVFLKVQTERADALFDHFATRILFWIVHQPEVRLLFLALGLAFLARRARPPEEHNPRTGWLLVLFLALFCFHLQFARWGWLFRYEAYLMVTGGWVLALATRDFWNREREIARDSTGDSTSDLTSDSASRLRPWLLLPPALGLVFVALNRGFEAFAATSPAIAHVHDQQIQMARFFRVYYRGQSVAANDVGAISYFSEVKLLDLYGIASRDVFEAKRAHRYDRNALTRIARARDVQVAALYPNWFVPGGQSGIPAGAGEILPASWQRVGTWTLGKRGEFGSEVAFYASNPRAAARLGAALRDFSAQLPATQKQSGIYSRNRE